MLNFNKFVREHTSLRVNKEAVNKIQKLTEEAVVKLIESSEFKAKDNGRKTILESDVEQALTLEVELSDEDIDSDD